MIHILTQLCWLLSLLKLIFKTHLTGCESELNKAHFCFIMHWIMISFKVVNFGGDTDWASLFINTAFSLRITSVSTGFGQNKLTHHWRIQRGVEGTFISPPPQKKQKIPNKHQKINGEERKQRERESEESLRLKLS